MSGYFSIFALAANSRERNWCSLFVLLADQSQNIPKSGNYLIFEHTASVDDFIYVAEEL